MPESAPQPDEELVFVADSIDEFVQRTRWQQIQEARTEAREALSDAPLQRANLQNRMSQTEAEELARQTVRTAVESYVMEVERLYQETEPGRKLWSDTQLAMLPARQFFALDTGGEDLELDRVEFSTRLGPTGDPDGYVVIGGVDDWLTLSDATVRYELAGMVQVGRTQQRREQSGTASVTTPVTVSKEVYRATNALVEALGPGMEIGATDSGTVEGTYAELLDKFDDEA